MNIKSRSWRHGKFLADELFSRLDADGIHHEDWRTLFLECTKCDRIISRAATAVHRCGSPTFSTVTRRREIDRVQAGVNLNELLAGGLASEDFRRLFIKCSCGIVTTMRAFPFHYCARPNILHSLETERTA